MRKHRVTAIRVGCETVDLSTLTLGKGFGIQVEIPFWVSAIEADGRRILVDSGIGDPERVSAQFGPCSQSPSERLDVALQQLGWEAESVEAVIHTHLHYDHCGGNPLLVNARFYVSGGEWEYARRPIPTQAGLYDPSFRDGEADYFAYYLTADHFEICPGVRVISTPGHTPGHQSVLVDTAEGVVCVAGDAVNMLANLDERTPPGLLYDAACAIRSIRRIREYADRIMPGHEPAIANYQDCQFPRA